MADYRDPKVTGGTRQNAGTGKWIGIAIAALVVLLLIAWFAGLFGGEEEVVEPEAVAPATEAPVTDTPATVPPATEAPATEPVAPAQQ